MSSSIVKVIQKLLKVSARVLPVLILQFAGSVALAANLNGVWAGTGVWETSADGKVPCRTTMLIFQSVTLLKVTNCHEYMKDGVNKKVCKTQGLDIEPSGLFLNGIKVGQFTARGLVIDADLGSRKILATANLNSNGTLDYSYEVSDDDGNFEKSEAKGLIKQP